MALKPGSLGSFGGSMAEAIEKQLDTLMQLDGAPPMNKDASDQSVRDRRRFLVAIARGVVEHLEANKGAIKVFCKDNQTKPVTVIERGSLAEDIARIGELAQRRGADTIIVGLPLNMDGSAGPQARRAKRFAGRLERDLGIVVQVWDERLSTVEAERTLLAAGERRVTRRGVRDAVAAAFILQSYLEAQRREDDE